MSPSLRRTLASPRALGTVLLAGLLAGPALGAELTLRVEGLSDASGELMVAVFDRESTFRKDPVRAVRQPAQAGSMTVRIADLPAGDYAVTIFHDRNGNGRLDTNRLGLPSEPWGASIGDRRLFGPPSWADARFGLAEPGAQVVVGLR